MSLSETDVEVDCAEAALCQEKIIDVGQRGQGICAEWCSGERAPRDPKGRFRNRDAVLGQLIAHDSRSRDGLCKQARENRRGFPTVSKQVERVAETPVCSNVVFEFEPERLFHAHARSRGQPRRGGGQITGQAKRTLFRTAPELAIDLKKKKQESDMTGMAGYVLARRGDEAALAEQKCLSAVAILA